LTSENNPWLVEECVFLLQNVDIVKINKYYMQSKYGYQRFKFILQSTFLLLLFVIVSVTSSPQLAKAAFADDYPGSTCGTMTAADVDILYGDPMEGPTVNGSLEFLDPLPLDEDISFNFATNTCYDDVVAYYDQEIIDNNYDPNFSLLTTSVQIYDSNLQPVTPDTANFLDIIHSFLVQDEYRLTFQYYMSFHDGVDPVGVEGPIIATSSSIYFNAGEIPPADLPSADFSTAVLSSLQGDYYTVTDGQTIKFPLSFPAASGYIDANAPTFDLQASPDAYEITPEDYNGLEQVYSWTITRDGGGVALSNSNVLDLNTYSPLQSTAHLTEGDYVLTLTIFDINDLNNFVTDSMTFTVEYVDPPFVSVTPRETDLEEIYTSGEFCLDVTLDYGGYSDEWQDLDLNIDNSLELLLSGTGILTTIELTLADFDIPTGALLDPDAACIDLDTLFNKFAPTPFDTPTIDTTIFFNAGYTNTSNPEDPLNFRTSQSSVYGYTNLNPFRNVSSGDASPFMDVNIIDNTTINADITSIPGDFDFSFGRFEYNANTHIYSYSLYNPTTQLFEPCTGLATGVYSCNSVNRPEITSDIFTIIDPEANFLALNPSLETSYFLIATMTDSQAFLSYFSILPAYVGLTDSTYATSTTEVLVNDTNYILFSDPAKSHNGVINTVEVKVYDILNAQIDVLTLTEDVSDNGLFKGTDLFEELTIGDIIRLQAVSITSAVASPNLAKYDSGGTSYLYQSNSSFDIERELIEDEDPLIPAEIITNDATYSPYYKIEQEFVLSGLNPDIPYLYLVTDKEVAGFEDFYPCYFQYTQQGAQCGVSALVYIEDPDIIADELTEEESRFYFPGLTFSYVVNSRPSSIKYKTFTSNQLVQGWNRINLDLDDFESSNNNPLTGNLPSLLTFGISLHLDPEELPAISQNELRVKDVYFSYLPEGQTVQSSLTAVAPEEEPPVIDPVVDPPTTTTTGTHTPEALKANFIAIPSQNLVLTEQTVCAVLKNTSTGSYTSGTFKIYKNQTIISQEAGENVRICFSSAGNYTVKLTVSNSQTGDSDTLERENYFSVTANGGPDPKIPDSTSNELRSSSSDDSTSDDNNSSDSTTDSTSDEPISTPVQDQVDPELATQYAACGNQLLFNLGTGADIDSDSDGCSDAIERTTGTNSLIPEPYACSAFTLANNAECTVSEDLNQSDQVLLNLTANPTLLPSTQFIIPGTVQLSSDETIKNNQICFYLRGNFDFNLGCQKIDSFAVTDEGYKLYNFAYYSTKKVIEGQYNLFAQLSTSTGKTITDSQGIRLGQPSDIPIDLVEFSGQKASLFKRMLSDPTNPESPVIVKAQKIKRGNDIYATFQIPYGYQVTGYFNSVVLTSAALADSSTGYATIKVPQWFNIDSESSHRLLAYAYDVTDPSIISQTIIVEFEGANTSYLMLIILIVALILLIWATFKLNKYLKRLKAEQLISAAPNAQPSQTLSPTSVSTPPLIMTDQDIHLDPLDPPTSTPSSVPPNQSI
jgi:hypothetical protein